LLQQGFGGQNHAGRAKATLSAAVIDKSLLHRMQRIVCAQPLNGYHLTPVGFEAENQTGINGLAIENDGAGATLAFAAPFFGTRIMEFLTQHLQQRLARFDSHLMLAAIHV
jgi:hypothetical protein